MYVYVHASVLHPGVCFQCFHAAGRSVLQASPTLKPHVRVFLSYRRVMRAAVTHARGCCKVKSASGPTGFTPRESQTGFRSFEKHPKTP